jgi:hypothetical protein
MERRDRRKLECVRLRGRFSAVGRKKERKIEQVFVTRYDVWFELNSKNDKKHALSKLRSLFVCVSVCLSV